jgi:pimeloyl-ACP methyl ester carboxylesterase
MDLRGHGRSEKPENVYADSRVWAEDLHAVITTLGLKRPVLVGWSYGGVVLTDYLRHYGQENVAGVQFVGALTRLGKPEFFADFGGEFLQLLPTLLSPDADQGRNALEAFADMLTQQPLAPQQRAAVLRYSSVVPLHVRLAIGQRLVDGADVLSALTVPVLATHGAVDRVVLPETSRRIASLAPNAELSLFPDVGHSPFAEDARRFNEELARFVARCG